MLVNKKKKLPLQRIQSFQSFVRAYYRSYSRTFPWRNTRNPYRILVSELMLQQTQTERVVPKYKEFLKRFPTLRSLSKAPLSDVLIAWSGLGYNRRAKFLWKSAKYLTEHHKGRFPSSVEELTKLPGIGAYTANALRAFIFDLDAICIETNIRTVFLYSFFKGKKNITDKQILSLISETLPTKNIRDWYYALMDLGAFLKKSQKGIDQQSKHYKKQSPFKGSHREVRGAVLKMLTHKKSILMADIRNAFPEKREVIPFIVQGLIKEGLIKARDKKLFRA